MVLGRSGSFFSLEQSRIIPDTPKLPGPEVAGKHPLNRPSKPTKQTDHVDPFQRKTKETGGNDLDPAKPK